MWYFCYWKHVPRPYAQRMSSAFYLSMKRICWKMRCNDSRLHLCWICLTNNPTFGPVCGDILTRLTVQNKWPWWYYLSNLTDSHGNNYGEHTKLVLNKWRRTFFSYHSARQLHGRAFRTWKYHVPLKGFVSATCLTEWSRRTEHNLWISLKLLLVLPCAGHLFSSAMT